MDKTIHEKNESNDRNFHETTENGIDYEKIALDNIEKEQLRHIIKHNLDPTEKELIYKRFIENKTQKDIAKEFEITQSGLCRIEKRTIKKIKKLLNENIEIKPTTLASKARKK